MKTEAADREKKRYEAPRLIEHGTVEDLTETPCDGISGACDFDTV